MATDECFDVPLSGDISKSHHHLSKNHKVYHRRPNSTNLKKQPSSARGEKYSTKTSSVTSSRPEEGPISSKRLKQSQQLLRSPKISICPA
jgi:hypothetical protein